MNTISLTVHFLPGELPDAETDVLLWDGSSEEGFVGALECNDPVRWIGTQGEPVDGIVAWAEMPKLKRSTLQAGMGGAAQLVTLVNGGTVDLSSAWSMPK